MIYPEHTIYDGYRSFIFKVFFDSGFVNRSYLETVVGPAAELHDAGLLVEGEVLDVHLAGRMIDGRRSPLHQTRVEEGRLRWQCHLEVTVGTEQKEE